MTRVCLLEDDSASMRFQRVILKKINPKLIIESFLDYKLLLRHYEKHPLPDMIFSDYCLPGSNGGEILRWFFEKGFRGPTFFVTACPDVISEDDMQLVDCVIMKPCERKDYEECLTKTA